MCIRAATEELYECVVTEAVLQVSRSGKSCNVATKELCLLLSKERYVCMCVCISVGEEFSMWLLAKRCVLHLSPLEESSMLLLAKTCILYELPLELGVLLLAKSCVLYLSPLEKSRVCCCWRSLVCCMCCRWS